MKRVIKCIFVLFVFVLSIICVKAESTHKWKDTYEYDTENHWIMCENDDCTINKISQMKNFGPHDFSLKIMNEDTLKKSANCTYGNVYYYSCKCGLTTRYIDSSLTFEDGKPTYIHKYNGLYAFDEVSHWNYCDEFDCNEKTNHQNHVMSNFVVVELSTATTHGYEESTCEVCGYAIQRELPYDKNNTNNGNNNSNIIDNPSTPPDDNQNQIDKLKKARKIELGFIVSFSVLGVIMTGWIIIRAKRNI